VYCLPTVHGWHDTHLNCARTYRENEIIMRQYTYAERDHTCSHASYIPYLTQLVSLGKPAPKLSYTYQPYDAYTCMQYTTATQLQLWITHHGRTAAAGPAKDWCAREQGKLATMQQKQQTGIMNDAKVLREKKHMHDSHKQTSKYVWMYLLSLSPSLQKSEAKSHPSNRNTKQVKNAWSVFNFSFWVIHQAPACVCVRVCVLVPSQTIK
jgi:hypothetical protein